MNGLYNKAVYWTPDLDNMIKSTLSKRYMVQPTYHMYHKLEQLKLPMGCYKCMLYGEVIEAEVENDVVVKIITRMQNKYNPTKDICAAIMFDVDEYGDDVARVKTIWVNAHDDDHKTICRENYIGG